MITVGDLLAVLRLQDELSPAVRAAVTELQGMDTSLEMVTKQSLSAEKQFQKTAEQITVLGRGLREAGVLATGLFTVPIVAATDAVIKFSSEFETQMMHVQTLAGTTKAEVDSLRQAVLDLGPAVGIGPAKLAEGLFVLESFGLRGAAAMDTLTVAAKMSALGMGETSETARGLAGAMFSYREQSLSAADAGEILAKAVSLGNVKIGELVPALATVGPLAAELHIRFEDVAASIATFTHAGVPASVASTGLRAALNNLLKDSATTEKGFQMLSTALGDTSISLANTRKEIAEKGLTTALVDLAANINKAGDAGSEAAAKIFPNVRGLTEFLGVYVHNAGMVVDINNQMNQSLDIIGNGMVGLKTTWDQQWAEMNAAIEKMWIAVGDSLLPIFEKFVSFTKNEMIPQLESLVKWFGSLPQPVQVAGFSVAGFLAIIGPGIIVLGQFAMAVGNIQKGLAGLTAVAGLASSGALVGAISGIGTIVAGLGLVAVSTYKEISDAQSDFTKRQTSEMMIRAQNALNEAGIHKQLTKSIEDENLAYNILSKGAQAAYAATKEGAKVTSDAIVLAKTAKLSIDEQVKALTDEQKAFIDSKEAIKYSASQIADAFKQQNEIIPVTTEIISLYEKQQKAATVEANKAEKQAQSLAARQSEYQATLDSVNSHLEEQGKVFNEVGATAGSYAKFLISAGVGLGVVKDLTGLNIDTLRGFKQEIDETSAAEKKYSEEYTAAEKMIQKTVSDTAILTAKASDDSLAAKNANIDKEYNSRKALLDKLSPLDINYYIGLVDLDNFRTAGYLANTAIQSEAHQKMLDELKKEDQKASDDTKALQENLNQEILRAKGDLINAEIAQETNAALRSISILDNRYNEEIKRINAAVSTGVLSTKEGDDQKVKIEQLTADQIVLIYETLGIKIEQTQSKTAVSWMNAGKAAIQAFGEGLQSGDFTTAVNKISNIFTTQLISSIGGSLKQKAADELIVAIGQAIGGSGKYATIGASIGSAIGTAIGFYFGGGPGAALGNAIGSSLGDAIGGYFDKKHAAAQFRLVGDEVGREMGLGISSGLATGIRTTEDNIQKMDASLSENTARHYAELLNLEKIFAEQGGITASNFESALTQTERLFEVIGKGGDLGAAGLQELSHMIVLLAAQAKDATGEWTSSFQDLLHLTMNAPGGFQAIHQAWDDLVKAGTDGVGLWNDGLIDLINHLKETGQNIEDVQALIATQQDKLSSGIIKATAAIGENAQAFLDDTDAVTKAKKAYDDLVSSGGDIDDITKAAQDLKDAQDAVNKVTVTTQDEFDRLSRIALNTFVTLLASGKDPVTAMNDIGDSIDALILNAKAFGLEGNAAFNELSRWRQLTKDNAALLSSIGGLNDVLVATANLGGLTADGFKDIEDQGVETYQKLLTAFTPLNATQDEADKARIEAETAMKPLLESIIQLHKEKGLAIDDETQKIIDQAEKDGVITDAQLSTNDILMIGFTAMIKAIGGDIPDAFKKFADAGKDAADKVSDAVDKIPKIVPITIDWSSSGTSPDDGGNGNDGNTRGPDDGSGSDNGPSSPKFPMAAGGNFLVTKPTTFLVGEAGPELASFSGANNLTPAPSGGMIIQINHPVIREEQDIQKLARELRDELSRRLKRDL